MYFSIVSFPVSITDGGKHQLKIRAQFLLFPWLKIKSSFNAAGESVCISYPDNRFVSGWFPLKNTLVLKGQDNEYVDGSPYSLLSAPIALILLL